LTSFISFIVSTFSLRDFKISFSIVAQQKPIQPNQSQSLIQIFDSFISALPFGLEELLSNQPIVLIALALIFVCAFLIIFFLTLIITSRIYKTYILARDKQLKHKLELLISFNLHRQKDSGLEMEEYSKKRQKMLSTFKKHYLDGSTHNRQILIEEIISFHKKFNGEMAENLRNLYVDLDLQNDSIWKLYSIRWEQSAKGIRELSEMRIVSALNLLFRFIDNKNSILRDEAQVALVRLCKQNHLAFLYYLTQPLSEWQQINLYHALRNIDRKKLPDFKLWIDSPNATVVVFCLKMANRFSVHFGAEALERLLKHSDEEVRLFTIDYIREQEKFEIIGSLVAMYERDELQVQIAIIKTIGELGGAEWEDFLVNILLDYDFKKSMEAAKALKKSGKTNEEILVLDNGSIQIHTIVMHVSDVMI